MLRRWPRRAVIDIGSNSVRLVIFAGPPRVPVTITNEKSLCGLGDREPETGELREEAVTTALQTLRRFRRVVDSERPESIDVFATAATREAPNGPAFLDAVREIGFKPRLLSGEEEARLAGLGIFCSAPEIKREGIKAIGGDLGGGSLELSLLGGPAEIGQMVSLPLGALRMTADFGDDLAAASRSVQDQLEKLSWLTKNETRNLYIVGGSWRAIARVAMHLEGHRVPILDHYMIGAEQAIDVCRFVAEADPDELGSISGVQKKRVPTLPMAALTLRHLVDISAIERVIVSACGVREGLLFDRLPTKIREQEPVLELAKDLASRLAGGRRADGRAVSRFLNPLFTNEPAHHARLRLAAATMVRVGNMTHPDTRAEHAAALIMAAPFFGIDHQERTMLAVMMATRFNGSAQKMQSIVPLETITEEQLLYAERVGYAHRVAAALRMPLYSRESGFSLERGKETLRLIVRRDLVDVAAEQAVKDFEKLAEVFGLNPQIVQSKV